MKRDLDFDKEPDCTNSGRNSYVFQKVCRRFTIGTFIKRILLLFLPGTKSL